MLWLVAPRRRPRRPQPHPRRLARVHSEKPHPLKYQAPKRAPPNSEACLTRPSIAFTVSVRLSPAETEPCATHFDLLEFGILGGGRAVISGEALDSGFVCEKAMRALFTVLLGAGDDSVVCDATVSVRRRSGKDEDVSRFSTAGEYRVDQCSAGFWAQFDKRRSEPLVRVGSGVFDLGRNNVSQRANSRSFVVGSLSNEKVRDNYRSYCNAYDRNPKPGRQDV